MMVIRQGNSAPVESALRIADSPQLAMASFKCAFGCFAIVESGVASVWHE
jgi:hypothetical protein